LHDETFNDKPTMSIQLSHPFKDLLPDADEAFSSKNEDGIINTVNAFCHKARQLADKYHPTDKEANDKFLGDAKRKLEKESIKKPLDVKETLAPEPLPLETKPTVVSVTSIVRTISAEDFYKQI
jgi:hypothetical protein